MGCLISLPEHLSVVDVFTTVGCFCTETIYTEVAVTFDTRETYVFLVSDSMFCCQYPAEKNSDRSTRHTQPTPVSGQ